MSIQKRLIPILFIFLVSFNCYSQKKADAAIAVHYQTKDFDVAIFPASYMNVKKTETHFTPSIQAIDTVELALKTHIKDLDTGYVDKLKEEVFKSNMNNYRRQYFGFIDSKGHKIIYINSFCTSSEFKFNDWLKTIITVDDGGSCFWHAKYDITTGKLFDFYVNGLG